MNPAAASYALLNASVAVFDALYVAPSWTLVFRRYERILRR